MDEFQNANNETYEGINAKTSVAGDVGKLVESRAAWARRKISVKCLSEGLNDAMLDQESNRDLDAFRSLNHALTNSFIAVALLLQMR